MILLFAGFNYYPNGGIADFIGIYSDLDKAKEYLASNLLSKWRIGDWYQLVSSIDYTIIEQGILEAYGEHNEFNKLLPFKRSVK